MLFHGLTANKMIMMYLARAMAEDGARVYIPDFPDTDRRLDRFRRAGGRCAPSRLCGD